MIDMFCKYCHKKIEISTHSCEPFTNLNAQNQQRLQHNPSMQQINFVRPQNEANHLCRPTWVGEILERLARIERYLNSQSWGGK